MYQPLTITIGPVLAPPWQATSPAVEGAELGVGGELGDSAGLADGVATTWVGLATCGDGDGDGDRAARDPREAPMPQALTQRIRRARPASLSTLEG